MNTLVEAATELSWKPFRLRQIQQAREIELKKDWKELTTLGKSDRDFLIKNVPFDSIRIVKRTAASDDSAVKFLVEALDGATFELVLLLHSGEKRSWGTVCVSSQIGCPVQCRFCATGQMGFERNLTTEEILDQFLIAKREVRQHGIETELNVVFMGMGEPLLNLEAVTPAIQTLTDPKRYGLSSSRITVSSSGIVPGLEKLREANLGTGLALSLHAPDDALRTDLMPINQSYPLAEILDELTKWERSGTEILYEYVLIAGVNDSAKNAKQLAKLLGKHKAKINLIPLNPIKGIDFRRPSAEKMRAFLEILEKAGLTATLRHTKGDKIKAACGQLKTGEEQVT